MPRSKEQRKISNKKLKFILQGTKKNKTIKAQR